MPHITQRDFDYIEARLLAPLQDVSAAHGRLGQVGYVEEADELMDAMKTFVDSCRAVRRKVTERANRDAERQRQHRPRR